MPPEEYHVPIGKGKVVRQGRDVTIVSISYALLECMKAGDILKTYGVDAEVIDLRSLRPLDKNLILESVKKTGNLVVVDHAELRFGMTGEIISTVVEECMQVLQRKPLRIAIKAYPTPTSYALAKDYYPNDESIVNKVLKLFEIPQTFTKKLKRMISETNQISHLPDHFKTSIIIGVTSDIGQALALNRLKKGYRVIGTYHNAKKYFSKKPEGQTCKLYKVNLNNHGDLKKFIENLNIEKPSGMSYLSCLEHYFLLACFLKATLQIGRTHLK